MALNKAKQRSGIQTLIAIALILTSTGLVASGIWVSIQLFINPNAVSWMNKFLPKSAQIPVVNPEYVKNLTQIRTKIQKLGKIPGEPIPLQTNADTSQPKSLLIPVLNQRANCRKNCQQIVELRLYQLATATQPAAETYYKLVDQIPIEGLDEALVISSLVREEVTENDSNLPLPLTELHRFTDKTPTNGIWLYLMGRKMQGINAIAYGQILYYSPNSGLSLLSPWTSTTGVVPQWRQVTGSKSPELFIDETVDLEPHFCVYQVKTTQSDQNQIQLEEISLQKSALKIRAYQNAIFLARNGLWSPALKLLQSIKQQQQQQRESWSGEAQAQMDLIRLYAKFTSNQAGQTWATPSQQVLAYLIDGRWEEARQVFQASSEDSQEVVAMLRAEEERLSNRVEAALQVNPNQPEVQAWKAQILAAQSVKR